jgi:hypothetical protein
MSREQPRDQGLGIAVTDFAWRDSAQHDVNISSMDHMSEAGSLHNPHSAASEHNELAFPPQSEQRRSRPNISVQIPSSQRAMPLPYIPGDATAASSWRTALPARLPRHKTFSGSASAVSSKSSRDFEISPPSANPKTSLSLVSPPTAGPIDLTIRLPSPQSAGTGLADDRRHSGSTDESNVEQGSSSPSSCYSTSSVSSMAPDDRIVHGVNRSASAAFSIASPVKQGVFDGDDDSKDSPVTRATSRNSSKLSLDKPLPPVPESVEMEPAPLQVGGRKPSTEIKQTLGNSQRKPVSRLDALDKAFKPGRSSEAFDVEALTAAIEGLHTQQERKVSDSGSMNAQAMAAVDNILQISRGPMDMVPTRRPPTPPRSKARARTGSFLPSKKRGLRYTLSTMASSRPGAARSSQNLQRHNSTLESGYGKWTPKSGAEKLFGAPGIVPNTSETLLVTGGDSVSQSDIQSSQQVPVTFYSELPGSMPLTSGSDEIDPEDFYRSASLHDFLNGQDIPGTPASYAASFVVGDDSTPISATAGESILLHIFEQVSNLGDLFSLALVSKGFYVTFKKHELRLMKNTLLKMSPAAWELREASPPYEDERDALRDVAVPEYTPTTYLRDYMRDMYTMVALKSLILSRCQNFLGPETSAALMGGDDTRAKQLDDAFWRTWTFCKLFGSNKGREDDFVGQEDWLKGGPRARQASIDTLDSGSSSSSPGFSSMGATFRDDINSSFSATSILLNAPEGFGRGNGPNGLQGSQLMDMIEMWTCLGVLLRGFRGKRRLAREHGVFDGIEIAVDDIEAEDRTLDEWVNYLLTLGPSFILKLAAPSDDFVPERFASAAVNGWNEWTLPESGAPTRAMFLKDACNRLYTSQVTAVRLLDERLAREIAREEEVKARRMDGARNRAPRYLEAETVALPSGIVPAYANRDLAIQSVGCGRIINTNAGVGGGSVGSNALVWDEYRNLWVDNYVPAYL